LAVAALLAATAGRASADETTLCNFDITSLPYTITAQGHYCLKTNLSTSITSGMAIYIASDFVTLDLNGFKLGGGGAGLGTTTYGIFTASKNIVIRNGNVRGFSTGIHLHQASSNVTVEDVTLDGNTYTGIRVRGTGGVHVIRRCTIADTGGSTDTAVTLGHAYGINHVGGPAIFHDNTVTGTFPNGGTAYNMELADPMAFNNRVIGNGTGFGLTMDPSALYENNTVKNVTTPYSSGTNLGSNYP
jgi:hypothetical protein